MGTVTDMENKAKKETPISMHGGRTGGPKGPSSGAASGVGMDRRVDKKKKPWKNLAIGAVALVVIGFLAMLVMDASSGRTYKVNKDRVVVSDVTKGVFEDFIPVRGRVTPLKTVFLDAIEGGRVEKVLVEDGAMLKKGDLIVQLSNTNLQLEVTRNEAAVTEQLNNMRTIELQLEQNRLQHKRDLVEIDYQIIKLTRQAERQRVLAAKGAVSQATLDDTEDALTYYKNKQAVTKESQSADAKLQESQLKFLQEASSRLENNLTLARQNLENLSVRAPVTGKLSGFDLQVGQSISRGGRMGQIDDPNHYKLVANIDEFYLGRVDIGQTATFDHDGKTYQLVVKKIYPQVNNGQFEVDFEFVDGEPQDIRRGQTLQTKLTLGDSATATLIPNGAFFQDTGGNWVFVVSPDGTQAVKRTVHLGRRNSRFIEVLDGLEVGEKVITSPYTSYTDMDRLKLGSK